MRNRRIPSVLRTPGRLFRASRRQAGRDGKPLDQTLTRDVCATCLGYLHEWYVEKNYGIDVRRREKDGRVWRV